MSEALFVAAVAIAAVYALLLECAHALASQLQSAVAVALILLWVSIQLHERAHR